MQSRRAFAIKCYIGFSLLSIAGFLVAWFTPVAFLGGQITGIGLGLLFVTWLNYHGPWKD